MEFLEFSNNSPLYEETMELRYRTFFKDFGLPKSVTPDELEPESFHLALLNKSELLAYGRLSPLGKGVFRISQVIVPEAHRRNGYASTLLAKLIDRAKSLGATSAQLNAQVSVQKLYENCGFVATEAPYKVKLTGIEHVKMVAAIGNHMDIRYLEDLDKSGICKLSHQINSDHYLNEPEVFCKPVAEGEDWSFWKESHEKEGGFVLVALSNNNVVGFVAAEVSDMPKLPFLNPMKRCKIATLVVADEHQKKGIGSALFEKVCEVAKERGAHRLVLDVFTFNNTAIDFYEKHGFRISTNHMSKSLA